VKTVAVIQHTEAEYLGMIEDHLEGRNVRFRYFRPFTHGGTLPFGTEGFDGLWLLGGIGLGALILSVATGGGAAEAPLRFAVDEVRATAPGDLAGHLPEHFPLAHYLRDTPVLPAEAEVLAVGPNEEPEIFAVRENCLGLIGHPGFKRGMVEDLVMEFADTPDDIPSALAALGEEQSRIAESLTRLMVGIVGHTGLM
jgi:hypothetical protein